METRNDQKTDESSGSEHASNVMVVQGNIDLDNYLLEAMIRMRISGAKCGRQHTETEGSSACVLVKCDL